MLILTTADVNSFERTIRLGWKKETSVPRLGFTILIPSVEKSGLTSHPRTLGEISLSSLLLLLVTTLGTVDCYFYAVMEKCYKTSDVCLLYARQYVACMSGRKLLDKHRP